MDFIQKLGCSFILNIQMAFIRKFYPLILILVCSCISDQHLQAKNCTCDANCFFKHGAECYVCNNSGKEYCCSKGHGCVGSPNDWCCYAKSCTAKLQFVGGFRASGLLGDECEKLWKDILTWSSPDYEKDVIFYEIYSSRKNLKKPILLARIDANGKSEFRFDVLVLNPNKPANYIISAVFSDQPRLVRSAIVKIKGRQKPHEEKEGKKLTSDKV